MKYMVFAGSCYYPRGGWLDFQGFFDGYEAALELAKSLNKDWWHIVDGDGNIVA